MARDRTGENVTPLDIMREGAPGQDMAYEEAPDRKGGQPGYTVRIRDLVLNMFIGVHEFEKASPQRVSISVELVLDYPEGGIGSHYNRVFCYESFIGRIRMVAEAGHVLLVEGFAERICALAFDDRRVRAVRVEVEKLDIFNDVGGVGTLIEKSRSPQ